MSDSMSSDTTSVPLPSDTTSNQLPTDITDNPAPTTTIATNSPSTKPVERKYYPSNLDIVIKQINKSNIIFGVILGIFIIYPVAIIHSARANIRYNKAKQNKVPQPTNNNETIMIWMVGAGVLILAESLLYLYYNNERSKARSVHHS